MSDELNAVVVQRTDIGHALMTLLVAPNGWEMAPFLPGQYATLGLPYAAPRIPGTRPSPHESQNPWKLIQRAYSIVSSPDVRQEYLEFYLTLIDDGELVPRLWTLKVGDRLFMAPTVAGTFTLDRAPEDRHVVFIASGTGIAPFISILRTQFTPGSARRFALFHGVRHSTDLAYRGELQALAHRNPNFSYHPIISRPQHEPVHWRGPSGHVQRLWHDGVLDRQWGFRPAPDNTHVFLCGSPAMIDEFSADLAHAGFEEHSHGRPGQVHLERYW